MPPVLRPTDPPFVPRPAGPAPGQAGPAPQAGGMAPGPKPAAPAGPGGPPAAPGGPPMPDPAELQREAMLALLDRATPVPGTVQRLPDGYDTMPKPFFPANHENRTRRSGQGY